MRDRERLDRVVAAIARHRYDAQMAVPGWLYAARFEHAFIEPELVTQAVRRRAPPVRAPLPDGDHLARLLAITDPVALFAALQALMGLAVRDDGDDPAAQLGDGAARNLVVVGAGPIGLALASALKLALGPLVNVVVVDDRVAAPGVKQPYARRWLTAIEHGKLAGIVAEPVRTLFARIGTQYIGATIQILETLLLLSCRALGVRFRFADPCDLAFVRTHPVDLVFDATGNRLQAMPSEATATVGARVETLQLQTSADVLATYGVDVRTFPAQPYVEIATSGALNFPLYRGRRIAQAMVKLVGVPARLCDELVGVLATRNADNRFYVWRGGLRDEINEGLVLVNLARAEYEALCAGHDFPLPLEDALAVTGLDARITELLALVAARTTVEERARMELDAPFVWRPYCMVDHGAARLHDTPLLRVGDSIYNGNVKLANGMGPHLLHVAHIQGTLWDDVTSAHARWIARAMGSAR